MAKKVVKKRKRKVPQKLKEVLPKPFKVADILDIASKADDFEVPVAVAEEIAKDIELASPKLTLTRKINESHLRDAMEAAFEEELAHRNLCLWENCSFKFSNVIQAFAHIRWHMILQTDDMKLSHAVMLAAEDRLWPQAIGSLSGEVALPLEERIKLRNLREGRLKVLRTSVG